MSKQIGQLHSACRCLILLALICLALAVLLPTEASAAGQVVTVRSAQAGQDYIYVAGNPDNFPLEYYQKETSEYVGIMPEVLRIVADRTGLKFAYIRSGSRDQRSRLVKNEQVELVSGLTLKELHQMGLTQMGAGILMGEYGAGDGYFAYTKRMSPAQQRKLQWALSGLSHRDMLGVLSNLVELSDPNYRSRMSGRLRLALILTVSILFILLIGILVYIRRKSKNEQKLFYVDRLTGLPNREYFEVEYKERVLPYYRSSWYVAFIGFDIYGMTTQHYEQTVTKLIREMADNLSEHCSEQGILARVRSGFLYGFTAGSEEVAQEIVQRLLDGLNGMELTRQREPYSHMRAGIYHLQTEQESVDRLIYNARQGYRNAMQADLDLCMADDGLIHDLHSQRRLRSDLEEAFRKEQFIPYMQFIWNGTRYVGAEAKIRWRHPSQGLLKPAQFEKIIQDHDLTYALDLYMVRSCVRILRSWAEEGRDLWLAATVSPITLQDDRLATELLGLFEECPSLRSRFWLEVHASEFDANLHGRDVYTRNLARLSDAGIHVIMDLSGGDYLMIPNHGRVHLSGIRLNHIRRTGTEEPDDGRALTAFLAMVRDLGLYVMCTGIENESVESFYRSRGVNDLAGNYYNRPMPESEVAHFLAAAEQ